MNKKDVTIIIVTYKSVHIILESLKNIVGKGYHIMMVDNRSNDSIENLLKQNYPNSDIELILLTNNCGFGRANNIALEKVTTKYAFIQNPDAIITETSIDNLVKEAEKDENIALANPFPTTEEEPSKSEQQDAINNYKKKIKILNEDKNIIETTSICGGYMLMNMDIFRKIGFFDHNLFLYGEDVELSQRSITKGYKNILVKNAHVFHYGQKSTEIHGTLAKYKMLYFRQWHQGWSKAYLKRKENNYFKIWPKTIFQFLSSFIYLIALDKKHVIIRLARSLGSASNLLGIDCFKKDNKIVKIKKTIYLQNFSLINFNINKNDSGDLIAIQNNNDIPFNIKRVFFTYNLDQNIVRGCHANLKSQFVLIAVQGAFKVKIKKSGKEKIFILNDNSKGLWINRMVWKDMYDFSKDCIILTLSSEFYDKTEYITNYNEYLEKYND